MRGVLRSNFSSLNQIRKQHELEGIRDYAQAYGRLGAITDDTQMTLSTAQGLIGADNRISRRESWHAASVITLYLRWLITQAEEPSSSRYGKELDGASWLSKISSIAGL